MFEIRNELLMNISRPISLFGNIYIYIFYILYIYIYVYYLYIYNTKLKIKYQTKILDGKYFLFFTRIDFLENLF